MEPLKFFFVAQGAGGGKFPDDVREVDDSTHTIGELDPYAIAINVLCF